MHFQSTKRKFPVKNNGDMKKNIAVFASGSGTNFVKIHETLEEGGSDCRVQLLISNNPDAGCLTRAKALGIPSRIIRRRQFVSYEEYAEAILAQLLSAKIEVIVLAGYMIKLPSLIIRHFPNAVLNIHPALLPSFGGKGFFGIHVHEAVLDAGVKVSGITVHFVNSEYDKGSIVLQKTVEVQPEDTVETLAEKVQYLEHHWYPWCVEKLCSGKIQRLEGKVIVHE